MDIQATFTLTIEELSDGIRRGLRPRIRKFTLMGTGVLVLALLLWWAGAELVFLLSVVTAGAMLVSIGPLLASRWFTRRLVKQSPRLAEERTIQLTDEGYHASVEGAEGQQSWSRIEGIEESGRSWLFRLGPNQVMVVPKRALTDEDDATFRRFVAEDFPRLSAEPRPAA